MKTVGNVERILCDNERQLADLAGNHFCEIVCTTVRERGRAVVALAGGTTPQRLYDRMVTQAMHARIPWQSIHWFWGDERAVPPEHPDSNYRLAMETALSRCGIDAIHVHRMPADAPKLEMAAATYERLLRATLGNKVDMWTFDIVLLGMGDDGHTASLFPGQPELDERDALVTATRDAHLGHRRMTLTYPAINRAREVMVLVSGQAKAKAVQAVCGGQADPKQYPIAGVAPERGGMTWFIDKAAAALCDHAGWSTPGMKS